MKKSYILCSVCILIVMLAITSLPLYRYYQPARPLPTYHIPARQSSDTLRILFIGDSWAAYHHDYDSCLSGLITSGIGKPCVVKSVGNVGAKSKEVYERMFSTTKPFLMEHPDYCIISAGINDAVAKLGTDYYTANYLQVVTFLLSQNITPIVIDMPDVDYRAVYCREPLLAKLRHRVSAVVTGADFYSFSPYRTALAEALDEHRKAGIIYIGAERWISNKARTSIFCDDGIHLNVKGYQCLDSCLSVEIVNKFTNSQSDFVK